MPIDSSVIITGRNAVREALEHDSASIDKVCIQQGTRGLGYIKSLASKSKIPIQVLPSGGLRRLVGKVAHQGIVALQSTFSYMDYSDMLASIAPDLDSVRANRPRILLLDGIQDPRNFGAIVRSAVAFDVNGLIVCSHHMASVTPAMVKASSGTATRIPIARIQRLADIIPELKERGYFIYGSSANGECSIWNVDWQCPVALVIGSEGRGLFVDTERECDKLISIPIKGDVNSLNVSVATGILLSVAYR